MKHLTNLSKSISINLPVYSNYSLRLIFTMILLLLISNMFGQGAIINVSNPIGVNVCDSAKTVTITIQNIEATSLTNVTLEVDLPTGIEYDLSSLSETSTYNIQELNIGSNDFVSFTANDLPSFSSYTFTIDIKAEMGAISAQNSGQVFRNNVTIMSNDDTTEVVSNAYNLYYPVLSVTSVIPTTQSIVSGDSYTRDITITNAGNGRCTGFFVTDVYGVGIDISSVSTGIFSATKDTITINSSHISNFGDNDIYLETGESVVITENIEASGCISTTVTSTINSEWGCYGETRRSSNSYAHTSISIKTPSLSVVTKEELSNCFGLNGASIQTIKLKNNGLGKAVNVVLDIFKSKGSSYDQDIFSRIDEDNITYQITNGASGTITPTTEYATSNSGDYACLGSNPIGRVLLNIDDIPSGEEITITFLTYHCNINVCDDQLVKGWRYELDYDDVCGNNSYSKNANGQNENDTYLSLFPESPSDINDGETKEFNYTISSFKNDLSVGPGARYKVVFTLPAGLSYTSLDFYHNVFWPAHSIINDVANNTLTAYYELPVPSGFTITKAEFKLNLTGDCSAQGATAGVKTISMNGSYIQDTTCVFEIPYICNQNVDVNLHCGTQGVCEGLEIVNFTFDRISFGAPDNDKNGIPDASGSLNFSEVKNNRAMYGDTLQGTFSGRVYTSNTNTSWAYAYAHQDIEWGTYLTPVGATLKVYDASAGTYLISDNLNYVTADNGLDTDYKYDLSPSTLDNTVPQFVGFTYGDGDSVFVYAKYRVTHNIGFNNVQLLSKNEFYNSTMANPGDADKYHCGYYNDTYTLIGYDFRNSSKNYYSVRDCDRDIQQSFYLGIGDCCSNYNGGNLFPSEYRNWAHIKTATVEIPAYYTFNKAWMYQYRTVRTNSSSTQLVQNITPVSINGNLYTFNLEQYYTENGGSLLYSDDGFSGKLFLRVTPSCDVPVNVYQDVKWKFNFAKTEFLDGGESGLFDDGQNDKIRFSPTSFDLASDNPTVDGLSKTVKWDLKVENNSSGSDANNAWIHIKNPSGNIQIVSIINDNTGDTLFMNGDIYHLGEINASNDVDLTIEATYDACYSDYITIYSGFECTGYPATFDNFKCNFVTRGLFVEPKPAQIQATLVGSTVGDDCSSTINIEIDVASVKHASVDSIDVRIVSHGDVTFDNGTAQMKYPLSGAYISIADPVSDNGDLLYNIEDINSTIGEDALPGVNDLTMNHFKINFDMIMGQDFVPGDYVELNISGQTICGEAVPTINLEYDPSVGFQMASSSGLTNDQTDSWSASWGDYNNDGYDDLFVSIYDDNQPNVLYKNNGDKTFTKITSGAIVTDKASSVSSSWGDYDNDGYLDLFVANNAGSNNFLYHNNGNNTFTRIMTGDIVEDGIYCHSAAWADYDNDGYLDLFVAEYFPTNTNHLFHNNQDGTFTAITGSPVVTDAGHSIGAAWGDYNNDGLVDLFVPNTNHEVNWLYKNIGNGQFVKVNEGVISTASNSVGCSWGDYNNDKHLDLFIANTGNSNNFLYVNNGDGSFTSVVGSPIVSDGGHSHGSTWIDLENDGDLDLYVTNDQGQDNFLYRNEGGGSFTKIENSITENSGESFGTAITDYDNDGDYDLFVANHTDNDNFFFENTKGQCSEYICLNLIGTNSNKSAIGASVKVKANIYGQDVWQMRQVTGQSGGGAGSQNTLKIIFGLGDAISVDSMIIEWPSGFKKIYTELPSTDANCTVYYEDDGAHVSGIAYIDENADCKYDDGEQLLSNVEVNIGPDDKTTYTNTDGEYSFYMNIGNYSVSAVSPSYYEESCTLTDGVHTVNVNNIGVEYPNNNFGYKPIGNQEDLTACMSTTVLRIGFTNVYAITYQNIGNDYSLNDTIVVTLDDDIDILSSTIPWDYKDGNTVYWYFDTIFPQTTETFYLKDSVTIDAGFGEIAINSIYIATGGSVDADLTNNFCNDNQEFVGAIDPNDKLVFPSDHIMPGQMLTYKIRFQNVGNYPAANVFIVDTLTEDLDISTLSNVMQSHECKFTVIENRILLWEFFNIDLPDSVHNEPESHGYVQFNIKPVANLPFGRNITNTATIIFDHFQFTATNNTTISFEPEFIESNKNEDLVVFPQPSDGKFVVSYQSVLDENVTITISDIIGQSLIINDKSADYGWNHYRFDLSQFESGTYFVTVKTDSKSISRKMILVK